jgi:hypothetical protein
MADEAPKGDPMKLLLTVIFFMVVLVGLWFYTGAYKNADLRGVFLAPPPPVGPGGAYGPQVGEPNPNYTNSAAQQ